MSKSSKSNGDSHDKDVWEGIKHFKPADFACRCGICQGLTVMAPDVVQKLDEIREKVGVPLKIQVGTRCRPVQSDMEHFPFTKTGLSYAVDLSCVDDGLRFKILKAALEVGFSAIKLGRHFIHLDDHPGLPRNRFELG